MHVIFERYLNLTLALDLGVSGGNATAVAVSPAAFGGLSLGLARVGGVNRAQVRLVSAWAEQAGSSPLSPHRNVVVFAVAFDVRDAHAASSLELLVAPDRVITFRALIVGEVRAALAAAGEDAGAVPEATAVEVQHARNAHHDLTPASTPLLAESAGGGGVAGLVVGFSAGLAAALAGLVAMHRKAQRMKQAQVAAEEHAADAVAAASAAVAAAGAAAAAAAAAAVAPSAPPAPIPAQNLAAALVQPPLLRQESYGHCVADAMAAQLQHLAAQRAAVAPASARRRTMLQGRSCLILPMADVGASQRRSMAEQEVFDRIFGLVAARGRHCMQQGWVVARIDAVLRPGAQERFEIERARLCELGRGHELFPVFHGAGARSTASICNNGFLTPDDLRTRAGGGAPVQLDQGFFGRGMYAGIGDGAFDYAWRFAHAHRRSPHVIIARALPGREYQVRGNGEALGGACRAGYDSHRSPAGKELVLFRSGDVQLLPMFVVTMRRDALVAPQEEPVNQQEAPQEAQEQHNAWFAPNGEDYTTHLDA